MGTGYFCRSKSPGRGGVARKSCLSPNAAAGGDRYLFGGERHLLPRKEPAPKRSQSPAGASSHDSR